ncbi:hypothetical protein I79_001349 [Cricetulus griseus]|uniref:Uncharacterized protein n=1 Tax=Cricetulus griseus TaxID=10029 RepID=G3GUI7_CRIGR|nr:hypothetical protein I79_001349 [Cricetulus griseus]
MDKVFHRCSSHTLFRHGNCQFCLVLWFIPIISAFEVEAGRSTSLGYVRSSLP